MNGSVVAPFPEKHGDDITKKLARKVSVAIIRFLSSVVICYPRKLHTVYERGKRLEELPNEILLKILSYCDFTSKMNMRAVNYRLYTLVETGAFTLVRRNLIGGVEIMDGCRSTDNTFDTGIPSSYYSSYHLTLSRPLKRVQLLVPAARLTNIMRHVSVCHSLKLCGVSLDEPLATNILEASFRTINDVTIDRVHTVTAETLGKLVRKAHPSKSLVFCNHSTLQASEAIVPDLLLSCTASNIAIEPSVSLANAVVHSVSGLLLLESTCARYFHNSHLLIETTPNQTGPYSLTQVVCNERLYTTIEFYEPKMDELELGDLESSFERLLIESDDDIMEAAESDSVFDDALMVSADKDSDTESDETLSVSDSESQDEWSSDAEAHDDWEFFQQFGPHDQLSTCHEPTDFYQLYLNSEIFSPIVEERNKQGKAKDPEFLDTNVAEIKKFIGLCIQMGVVHMPRIRDYWSSRPAIGGNSIAGKFHRFFDDAALVRLVISDQAIRRTIRLPLCAVTHNGISKAAQAFYKRCCDVMAEVTAEMRAPQWEIFVSFPSSMLIKRDMIEVPAEMRGQCTVWGYLPYYEDSFVVEVRVGGMNLRIVVESP
ncbi:hypothetical protein RB195_010056 [Necator americanus]|uniref:F-box domain-containing protein n=1 Tax=Necator americanus TaxID=51031 RepID=A0ABR1CW65_NECAM